MWVKLWPAILTTSSHSPFRKHTELCLISGDFSASSHPQQAVPEHLLFDH